MSSLFFVTGDLHIYFYNELFEGPCCLLGVMFRETGTVTCTLSKPVLLSKYYISHTSTNEYVDYLIYDTALNYICPPQKKKKRKGCTSEDTFPLGNFDENLK